MAQDLSAALNIAIRTVGVEKIRTLSVKLDEATGDVKQLSMAMHKLNDTTRRLSTGGLSAVGRGFSGLLSIGSKMTVIGYGIAAGFRLIARAAEAAMSPVVEFTSAMAQVRIKGGFTVAQTAALSQQAMQMGRTTMFAPTEAAKAQVALAASGLSPEQIASSTPTVLKFAQASDMGTDEASDFLINVARQFQMDLSDPATLNRVGNALVEGANASTISVRDLQQTLKYAGPVANVAGTSVEQLIAESAIMGNSGLKASQAGSGARNLFSSFAKPKGGKLTKELLAEIGLTTKDLQNGMKDIPSFLELMDKRMIAKGHTGQKRIALAASLFGQYGMTAATVLIKAAGTRATGLMTALQKMEDMVNGGRNMSSMDDVGRPGAMDVAADVRGATVEGKLSSLSARWQTLWISIGEKLMPHMERAADGLIAKIEQIESSVRNDPKFGAALDNIGETFVAFTDLIGSLSETLPAVCDGLTQMLNIINEFMPTKEQKDRDADAASIPVFGPGIAEGSTAGNITHVAASDTQLGLMNASEGGPNMSLKDTKRLADYLFKPSGEYDDYGIGSKKASKPSAVEIKITTDDGTTARVSEIKKGDVDLTVNMSVEP